MDDPPQGAEAWLASMSYSNPFTISGPTNAGGTFNQLRDAVLTASGCLLFSEQNDNSGNGTAGAVYAANVASAAWPALGTD